MDIQYDGEAPHSVKTYQDGQLLCSYLVKGTDFEAAGPLNPKSCTSGGISRGIMFDFNFEASMRALSGLSHKVASIAFPYDRSQECCADKTCQQAIAEYIATLHESVAPGQPLPQLHVNSDKTRTQK